LSFQDDGIKSDSLGLHAGWRYLSQDDEVVV